MKKLNNCLRSMSSIAAIGLFSMLVLLSPLMATTAFAQRPISENNFRRDGDDPDRFVLSNTVKGADNDIIHLKMEKVPELKNKVEIVLVSSSNVRWWKGITIFKGFRAPEADYGVKYVRFRHIDTQDDDHSESSMAINISDLGDFSYLTFEKAKAFGVHTPMYSFFLKKKGDKDFKYAGHRLTFTWERDG